MKLSFPFNAFSEVEKMLHYRFWDKERERSNHAALLRAEGPALPGRRPVCPTHHDIIAWSGPPHDSVRAYICLRCHGAACEPEIRYKGFDFETIPDWEIYKIMDDDLVRQAEAVFTSYRPGQTKQS